MLFSFSYWFKVELQPLAFSWFFLLNTMLPSVGVNWPVRLIMCQSRSQRSIWSNEKGMLICQWSLYLFLLNVMSQSINLQSCDTVHVFYCIISSTSAIWMVPYIDHTCTYNGTTIQMYHMCIDTVNRQVIEMFLCYVLF